VPAPENSCQGRGAAVAEALPGEAIAAALSALVSEALSGVRLKSCPCVPPGE